MRNARLGPSRVQKILTDMLGAVSFIALLFVVFAPLVLLP